MPSPSPTAAPCRRGSTEPISPPAGEDDEDDAPHCRHCPEGDEPIDKGRCECWNGPNTREDQSPHQTALDGTQSPGQQAETPCDLGNGVREQHAVPGNGEPQDHKGKDEDARVAEPV